MLFEWCLGFGGFCRFGSSFVVYNWIKGCGIVVIGLFLVL